VTLTSSRYLQGAGTTTCSGVGRWYVSGKFERSSWSGYREYSSPTNSPIQAGDVSVRSSMTARCGTGGTYDYHLELDARYSPGGGVIHRSAGPASRYSCGTGNS
jgi:hypothetical protein